MQATRKIEPPSINTRSENKLCEGALALLQLETPDNDSNRSASVHQCEAKALKTSIWHVIVVMSYSQIHRWKTIPGHARLKRWTQASDYRQSSQGFAHERCICRDSRGQPMRKHTHKHGQAILLDPLQEFALNMFCATNDRPCLNGSHHTGHSQHLKHLILRMSFSYNLPSTFFFSQCGHSRKQLPAELSNDVWNGT